uniref:Uncharacterized protein n=1 Tax=uncultured bacterium pA1 TaxID=1776268 RepID=A0A0U3SJ64_9BACT|nr:hypothetical protein [uncultured bacterium pA1]
MATQRHKVFATEILEGIIKLLLFILAGFMGLGLLMALGASMNRRNPPLTDDPKRTVQPPKEDGKGR